MDWFAWDKLIERLRGKPKRSPREIVQSYGRQIQPTQPRQTIQTRQSMLEPPVNSHVEQTPSLSEENFVLDIDNAAALEGYVNKLKNLSGFERFASLPSLNWLHIRLDRVIKELHKLNELPDFDEDFNFELAKKVRKISANMLDILRDTKTSTQLYEPSRRQLTALVENYLSSIGVTKKVFNVGDDYIDWANLGMSNSYELIPTNERAKASTIAAIEIQPHEICYRNEHGEIERITFGGSCKVYTFREV